MKLSKVLLAAALAVLFVGSAHAWRRNGERTTPVFIDRGANTDFFTQTVGTTTPVALFSAATYASGVREVTICNAESFRLYIGTFSAVSGSTTAVVNSRDLVPTNTCRNFSYTNSLWGIYESASGGTSKVVTGSVYYQLGD